MLNSKAKSKKVLITGASGFIGHAMVEEMIRRGYETWAGVRASSRVDDLQKMGSHVVILTCEDSQELVVELNAFKKENGCWDYVVHTAGVTKCIDNADFMRVNYENTRRLIETLAATGLTPQKFIFLSSLSISGAIHENSDTLIREQDEPKPNTAYGRSKLCAERYITGLSDYPYIILRPTGVYGPREKDYLMMAQSIKKHIDFSVGYKKQYITFIYVQDLVQAVFRAMETPIMCRTYLVSDGNVYMSRDFSDLLQKELGVKMVLHIKCPLFILKVISLCANFFSSLLNKSSTLNPDKYKIMKQRNWRCDIAPIEKELGYKPEFDLRKGVKQTIEWYKTHKWI
jgi:dihydroflavonol-4-reductase